MVLLHSSITLQDEKRFFWLRKRVDQTTVLDLSKCKAIMKVTVQLELSYQVPGKKWWVLILMLMYIYVGYFSKQTYRVLKGNISQRCIFLQPYYIFFLKEIIFFSHFFGVSLNSFPLPFLSLFLFAQFFS